VSNNPAQIKTGTRELLTTTAEPSTKQPGYATAFGTVAHTLADKPAFHRRNTTQGMLHQTRTLQLNQ